MMDEDKQLDNTQGSTTADTSEVSKGMTNGTMSAETNPDAEMNSAPQFSAAAQGSEVGAEAEVNSTNFSQAVENPDGTSGELSYRAALEELTAEVEALKSQLDERNGQYMRIAADFDNFRKRTQKEREELEQQVKCSTIVELLPVVDNFERARSQLKPQTDGEMNIHKSYQSVYKQLVDCLKRIGVAPMRSEGKEFDPNLHEAVMREATDEYAEGTVVEELMRGYLLGERVLRHAMVKVAAPLEPAAAEEGGHGDVEG